MGYIGLGLGLGSGLGSGLGLGLGLGLGFRAEVRVRVRVRLTKRATKGVHAARKVAEVYCGLSALSEKVSDHAAAPALMKYSCSFIEHYTNRRQILHYIEATAMCTLWRLASDSLYYPRAKNLVMLHKQSENR